MGAMLVIWFSCFCPGRLLSSQCFFLLLRVFLFFSLAKSSRGPGESILKRVKAISALDNVSPYGYGLVWIYAEAAWATRAPGQMGGDRMQDDDVPGRAAIANKQFNT